MPKQQRSSKAESFEVTDMKMMRSSKHDSSLEKPFVSPLKKHYCTDIICFVLFWAFIVVLALLSAVAYKDGDPESLILPHDSKGIPVFIFFSFFNFDSVMKRVSITESVWNLVVLKMKIWRHPTLPIWVLECLFFVFFTLKNSHVR
jgi:hypothetical protein